MSRASGIYNRRRGRAPLPSSTKPRRVAAMFNKKTMVLYCGGAPGLAPAAPQSPCGGGGGGGGEGGLALLQGGGGGGLCWPPTPCAEGPRVLIGGGPRAGPLSLIGPPHGPPRALIGPPAPLEGELDGCETDSESEGDAGPPACPAAPAAPAPDRDPLRQMTLEVVGSYLRQAAAEEEPPKEGGGGGKFLQGLLGRFGASPGEAKTAARALETLRRVCDDILNKHQLVFQGILRKMEIEKADDLKIVSEVAMQVFSDGVTNWGRIVTLISFGAFVAKHLKSINQDSGISTLAEIITDVLVTDKREWLLHHNAWEGFVKFFHVEDLEGSIRNILVAFASVAGIGASLAYLIR